MAAHECLTCLNPILIAKELVAATMTLPVTSLQIHGIGMTEKVFDIACALADVLPFVSPPTVHVDATPQEYLGQIVSLLTKLPGGTSKFVPLLLAKIHELLPDLVQKLCSAADMPLVIFSDPMSPDTRFVYEEEVGRALYTDLRRDR
ncbi:hypothetical protein EK21DRAFT_118045 [Setomelanomma holmii]|uniref:Uncharacterized protein n=1 Tax=Setomelanomma holmii TaxID=210430 RepID=A0A9P4GYS1_9PLEO|nr:hypothetical protein EK21DRAFT_118045 [Setomelanomma holmii]